MGRFSAITLTLAFGISWLWISAAACAGSEPPETGSNSDQTAAPAATGGAGGMGGGMGGIGGMGGMGGIGGGMGGAGGEEVPCTVMPCKLTFPQCGCGDGEKCTVQGAGGLVCEPAGPKGDGEACTPGECGSALFCHNNLTGGVAMCHDFCETDEDCVGPGSLCVLPVAQGAATVCSQNCDMVSNVGCNVPGMKCDLAQEALGMMRQFTRCTGSGPLGQGEVCTGSNQCGLKMACFGIPNQTDNECLTWCRTDQGNCPSGTMCTPFQPAIIIGAITYGACLGP